MSSRTSSQRLTNMRQDPSDWAARRAAAIDRAQRLRQERKAGYVDENHTFSPQTTVSSHPGEIAARERTSKTSMRPPSAGYDAQSSAEGIVYDQHPYKDQPSEGRRLNKNFATAAGDEPYAAAPQQRSVPTSKFDADTHDYFTSSLRGDGTTIEGAQGRRSGSMARRPEWNGDSNYGPSHLESVAGSFADAHHRPTLGLKDGKPRAGLGRKSSADSFAYRGAEEAAKGRRAKVGLDPRLQDKSQMLPAMKGGGQAREDRQDRPEWVGMWEERSTDAHSEKGHGDQGGRALVPQRPDPLTTRPVSREARGNLSLLKAKMESSSPNASQSNGGRVSASRQGEGGYQGGYDEEEEEMHDRWGPPKGHTYGRKAPFGHQSRNYQGEDNDFVTVSEQATLQPGGSKISRTPPRGETLSRTAPRGSVSGRGGMMFTAGADDEPADHTAVSHRRPPGLPPGENFNVDFVDGGGRGRRGSDGPLITEGRRPASAGSDEGFGGRSATMASSGESGDLIECPNCSRSFNERALQVHRKVCQTVFSSKRKPFDSAKARVGGTDAAQFAEPRSTLSRGVRRTSAPATRRPSGTVAPSRRSTSRGNPPPSTTYASEGFAAAARPSMPPSRPSMPPSRPIAPRKSVDNARVPRNVETIRRRSSSGNEDVPVVGDAANQTNWRAKSDAFRAMIRRNKAITKAEKEGRPLDDLIPAGPAPPDPSYIQCPHCQRRFNEQAAERHIPKCQSIRAKPTTLIRGTGTRLGQAAREKGGTISSLSSFDSPPPRVGSTYRTGI